MKKGLIICIALITVMSVLVLTGCGDSGTEMTPHLSYGDRTGIYNGDVNDEGIPDGQGTFETTNSSGSKWTYTGSFKNGHFEGEGEIAWASGQKEIGVYHDDEIQPEPADEVANMYKNPDEYKYHCFEITGKVFNVIGSSDGQLHFQLYENIEQSDNNTYVIYNGDMDLKEDDYVRVVGVVQGTEEYDNLIGGTTSAVVVFSDKMEVLSYIDAVSPTLKEVKVDKSQSQYGYEVTVEKVEFAPEETRVYVNVKNGGKATFSLYTFDAIAVQNGKQYKHEDNWEADYPEIQTDLRAGNSTEGILVFKGLEQKDFKVIMNAYSEDWDETLKDYEIEVKVD